MVVLNGEWKRFYLSLQGTKSAQEAGSDTLVCSLKDGTAQDA